MPYGIRLSTKTEGSWAGNGALAWGLGGPMPYGIRLSTLNGRSWPGNDALARGLGGRRSAGTEQLLCASLVSLFLINVFYLNPQVF